jgi:ADP-ribosylglycohydrolase
MTWDTPYRLLAEEIIQRRDEGADIPAALLRRFAALHPQADAWNQGAADALWAELDALPEDAALAAAEPNDLAGIRALRPEGPRDLRWSPGEDELLDRLHGAWTGRCVGCALGKPVEGMGMAVRDGASVGRADIRRYLGNRGEWPLRDYFSARAVGDGMEIGCPASTREGIAYMEPDDDIHYSLTGMGVVEQHGPEFTWEDVARWWCERIPVAAICTAERQAVLNWLGRSVHYRGQVAATPAFTRRHRNPYREWIGAQIRSDGWAWVCAGQPALAAEFAWRDAQWTHERNGIYGAMFFAAMQAAAFCVHDARELVAIGLAEIPRDCRLARVVRATVGWCAQDAGWEDTVARVEAMCATLSRSHHGGPLARPFMSPVHTINNAAFCVAALIHGRLDSRAATTIAVMAGADTDCNGASVGSIAGAACGRKRFDPGLAAPLHDTIRPSLIGFQEVTMAQLARRTAAVWRTVRSWADGRAAVGLPVRERKAGAATAGA